MNGSVQTPHRPILEARLAAWEVPGWVGPASLLLLMLVLLLLPQGSSLLVFFLTLGGLFLLPGCLVLSLVERPPHLGVGARIGWGFALGICMVGLIFVIASAFQLHLGAWFWRGYVAIGIGGALGWGWHRRRDLPRWATEKAACDAPTVLLGLGIALAGAANLLPVLPLLAPPLHDPAAHALMAKLVAEAGHIPLFQQPYRSSPFFYPPGLACLVAATHLVSGISIAKLVLFWTNFSTVLAAIACYAVVSLATRSRGAGIFAFGFFAFVSQMPTHEFFAAGKNASVVSNFVFLGAVLAALRLRQTPSFSYALLTAALSAESFLMHYEKAYFLCVFALAYLLSLTLGWRQLPWRRYLLALAGTCAMALLFASPWLLRLRWAFQYARASGVPLMPVEPSSHGVGSLTVGAIGTALTGYWGAIWAYVDPTIASFSLLAPLAAMLAGTFSSFAIACFSILMALFHPAVVEPLGISMAALSYDRISVHFAYLPVCLAAAMGVWLVWRGGRRMVPERFRRGLRTTAIAMTALLLLVGGVSRFSLYRRVAHSPVDALDVAAFAWADANLPNDRPFLFPVGSADHVHRRYFLHGPGLYLPLFTRHDVLCNYVRIETDQIVDEYRRFTLLLADDAIDAAEARYWVYTREDQPDFSPVHEWLNRLPASSLHERYRGGPVRIFELRSSEKS